jgi:hypothetical protein
MGNRKSREYQKPEQDRALWDRARTTPRNFAQEVQAPGIGIRRLRVIFVPSFENGSAWGLRALGPAWKLFRSVASSDEEMLSGYEEMDADGDMLRGYFDRLQALTLPIGPLLLNNMGGADGTTYHLALFGDLYSEARFRWWTDYPPQWTLLVDVVNDMIEAFLCLRPRDV